MIGIAQNHPINRQREAISNRAPVVIGVFITDEFPGIDLPRAGRKPRELGEFRRCHGGWAPLTVEPDKLAVWTAREPEQFSGLFNTDDSDRARQFIRRQHSERTAICAPGQGLAGNQSALVSPSAHEKAPRVHGNRAADDPENREHPKAEAREVMPASPAPIGRETRAATKLRDTEIESERGEKPPGDRGPDHDSGP